MSLFFHTRNLKLISKERIQNCVRHCLFVKEGSAVLHLTVQEYIQTLNRIHMRALISNLVDNTNKRTSTITYNPVTLRHFSIFLDHPHGVLHQTRIYKTQKNYQIH